ncbi:MAG: sugar phosphate isomerase/epimerase [Gemmatimonadaceae bacterium]|nr:sugar phosphate isomerase/epimerase [Gemmatimonadaceae bacterium]
MQRRDWLVRTGAAAMAASLGWRRAAAAEATESADRPLERIGIQLYSVRSLMAQDFDGTLRALAGIGYREVEFAGWFGRTPAQVKAAVAAAGLTAPSAHVDLAAFRADPAKLCAEHAEAGHQTVVIAWMLPAERKTLDDWKRRADEFQRFAEAAKRAGLGFGYHNHEFEFMPIDGTVPFELLTTRTDPALVRLELDLYWATVAGVDPLAWMRRWPGRVRMVHVKDRSAEGKMVDVGAGVIAFDALLREARRLGLAHVFVEHDAPADPMGFARASYAWLSRRDV